MPPQPTTHLVLVCCHGIWLGGQSRGDDEKEWLIASFQQGETPTFTEHAKAGLRLLSSSPQTLLVFSGGPTRPETKISEAESYVNLAEVHDHWELLATPDLKERVVVEKRALDSFHNLLFSITKFYEVTHAWPEHVTIISNEFKRARFLDLHCPAIAWPTGRVSFVGVDPDYMAEDLVRAASVREGERKNGFDLWKKDMRGIGQELEGKRTRRNPWLVKQSLFEEVETINRSGIHFMVFKDKYILGAGPQPWET